MARSLFFSSSIQPTFVQPRKRLTFTWPGFVCLFALLLCMLLFLYQTSRLAFLPPSPATEAQDSPVRPAFPTLAEVASHPMFAPLMGAQPDSIPNLRQADRGK